MSRALRFVVPFGREGAADRAARAFAAAVSPSPLGEGRHENSPSPLGEGRRQNSPSPLGEGRGGGHLAVENLPGQGGLLGVQRANALCDSGEPVLLLSTPTTHVLLPARLGADAAPRPAFAPVAGLGFAPNVLLVSPRLGVRSVEELVSRARAERLVYASAGTGQTIHVCTALFCEQAGIAMEHRPYDGGSATAYEDLIAGRVQVYFDNLLGCRDRIAQGDAVPLAVSARRRSALLPEVPTLIEAGFPEHALEVWLGVFAAHVDDAAAEPLHAAAADPALAARLAELGLEGGPLGRDAFIEQLQPSRDGWRRVTTVFHSP